MTHEYTHTHVCACLRIRQVMRSEASSSWRSDLCVKEGGGRGEVEYAVVLVHQCANLISLIMAT